MPKTPTLSETLSNSRDGYIQLSTIRMDNNYEDDFTPSPRKRNRNACFVGFFTYLYHYFIAFLRLLCFRLPRNLDNESLITVDYRTRDNNKDEDLESLESLDAISGEVPVIVVNPCFQYNLQENPNRKWRETCPSNLAAICEIKASQVKSEVIAQSGKVQLNASKEVVCQSKQRLKEVQNDITNIRDDMETAKKLFLDVENGIKEYKWDTLVHETKASIEYQGKLSVFPVSTNSKYLNPFEQMYWDHRIFIEEMRYHFKWNHGILL